MYHEDETVMYGAEGVCQITGKTEKLIDGILTEYYVLKPLHNNATIYVPTNNAGSTSKIRRILSLQEMQALIDRIPFEETIWIEDERVRREHYRAILAGGNRLEWIRLLKTLSIEQKKAKSKGGKLRVSDDRFLRDTEKMFHEEIAYVFGPESEAAIGLLASRIQGDDISK